LSFYGPEKNGATPVLLLDKNDNYNYVKNFFLKLYTEAWKGFEITVLSGAKYWYYNTQPFTIQKLLNMTNNIIN